MSHIKSQKTIVDALRKGALIHYSKKGGFRLVMHNKESQCEPATIQKLLDEEFLMPVACGCTGFWWTLWPRIPLMRMESSWDVDLMDRILKKLDQVLGNEVSA